MPDNTTPATPAPAPVVQTQEKQVDVAAIVKATTDAVMNALKPVLEENQKQTKKQVRAVRDLVGRTIASKSAETQETVEEDDEDEGEPPSPTPKQSRQGDKSVLTYERVMRELKSNKHFGPALESNPALLDKCADTVMEMAHEGLPQETIVKRAKGELHDDTQSWWEAYVAANAPATPSEGQAAPDATGAPKLNPMTAVASGAAASGTTGQNMPSAEARKNADFYAKLRGE